MKTTLFILCLYLLSSCSESVIKTEGYLVDVDHPEKEESVLLYSSIFEPGKTIMLETNEQSLIGYIDKMQVYKDTILVLDRHGAQSVLLFTNEGRFIRRIGAKGPGPTELASLGDFTIDHEKGEVYILDRYRQRILRFSISSGKFISAINITNDDGGTAYKIEYVNGVLYADANYVLESSDKDYILQKIDVETGKCFGFYYSVKDNSGWDNSHIGIMFPFYFTGERFFFSRFFMNRVIDLSTNDVPETYFTLGSKNFIRPEDVSSLPNSEKNILDKLWGIGKVCGMDRFVEHNNYLYFKYEEGGKANYVVFNTDTRQTTKYKRVRNDYLFAPDTYGFSSPMLGYPTKDGVYFFYLPRSIPDLILALKSGVISNTIDKYEELLTMPEDSNPVVLYYKYKE